MSELPAGWSSCQVDDLIERIETGKSVRCDERPPVGDEKGLVKISAVTWGEFDESESKTLFSDSLLKPDTKIQLGDLLISRANTLELVGACVLVKQLSKKLYLSDKILRLVLCDTMKPWLLTCLRSQEGRKQIEQLATGNQLSMRNISQKALGTIRIPLPPLAEQLRISTKLEELLAHLNTLNIRINSVPFLLKRFRQSVLAAAVSGRLTDEWRAALENSPRQTENEHARDAKPAWWNQVLPPGWESDYYENLVESRLGKMLDKAKNTGTATPYLGNINVRWLKFDTESLQTIRVTESEIRELSLLKGDVLICEGGEPGRCAIWRGEEGSMIFQKALHRARPSPRLLPEWLVFNLKNDADNNRLAQLFTGSTIKHLTGKSLARYPVRLPPLDEQTEIVRRIEQLFAFADQLEAKVAAAKTRIDQLTQSILAKAFRGELVPQDPDDEPASVLLERIKAQRVAAPKATRKKKAN